MQIAIDVSPLISGHKFRGTGFYVKNLANSLKNYYPENSYNLFTKKDYISKNTNIIHYPYFEPFFLSLPFIKKYKTVVSVLDLIPLIFPQHFPAGIRGRLIWNIQKKLLKRADAIITISNCSKKDIAKLTGFNEAKIFVTYLAAGEEFKQITNHKSKISSIRKRYGLPDKFALYVGDATWNKNVPNIIRAVENISTPLVLVGRALADNSYDHSNPWNKDLVKISKVTQSNKNIYRLGFVPIEDLVLLYNIASVFVMPSLYEGFGLPILEAMQSGCPVVTSKEGSLHEVAGEACVYVDPYSIDSIATGIKNVISSKSLQKTLREKGFVQAKKFSWQKTAQETTNVYMKVVSG